TDLEMVARLEKIRLDRAALFKGENDAPTETAPAYARAFRDYGLDLEALAPQAAGERIGACAIKNRLLAALDHWILVTAKAGSARLLAVAGAAEADSWRDKLFSALERRDPEYLEALAQDRRMRSRPAASQLLLAAALEWLGRRPLAIKRLRQLQKREPS